MLTRRMRHMQSAGVRQTLRQARSYGTHAFSRHDRIFYGHPWYVVTRASARVVPVGGHLMPFTRLACGCFPMHPPASANSAPLIETYPSHESIVMRGGVLFTTCVGLPRQVWRGDGDGSTLVRWAGTGSLLCGREERCQNVRV